MWFIIKSADERYQTLGRRGPPNHATHQVPAHLANFIEAQAISFDKLPIFSCFSWKKEWRQVSKEIIGRTQPSG
jgi:hypothetical protein